MAFPGLVRGDPLLDGVQYLLGAGLQPEAHPGAAGFLHGLQHPRVNGVHPGVDGPGDLQPAVPYPLADGLDMGFLHREGVVHDVDLLESQLPVQHLDLVHHQPGVAIPDAPAEHLGSGAENAAEGTTAAGDDGGRHLQSAVLRYGEQVPRRKGQAVQVLDERPRSIGHGPAVPSEGNAGHIGQVAALGEGFHQLHDRLVAFANDHHVDPGSFLDQISSHKAGMRPADEGDQARVELLAQAQDARSGLEVDCGAGGADNVRLEVRRALSSADRANTGP